MESLKIVKEECYVNRICRNIFYIRKNVKHFTSYTAIENRLFFLVAAGVCEFIPSPV